MVVPCAPSLLLLLSMAALSVLSCAGPCNAWITSSHDYVWPGCVSLMYNGASNVITHEAAALYRRGACLGPLCAKEPLSNCFKSAKLFQAVDPYGGLRSLPHPRPCQTNSTSAPACNTKPSANVG